MPGRSPDAVFDRLFTDLPEEVTGDDLKDPGLHPAFQLFTANLLTGYLRYAPGRINALVSTYALTHDSGQSAAASGRDLTHARKVFLDSGAITVLLGCSKGTATPDMLMDWLARTDDIIRLAWRLHEDGVPPGVVAAMDLPSYAGLLGAAGLTVAEAEGHTLRNAEYMLDAILPPGWIPVFTSQGVSIDEHRRCLDGYERAGVLDAVRNGNAWLAVGGMAFEGHAERIHQVHHDIRKRVPVGHIHALGVSRLKVLVPMVRKGWVNSADSSSPAQEVRYNRGPYAVKGPRPSFLWEACHAASSLYYEAELAKALELAHRQGEYHQEGIFDGT